MKIKNAFKGGRVNIPSSKSYHHRYLIANALSLIQKEMTSSYNLIDGKEEKNNKYQSMTIEIESIGFCDDVCATINALRQLGVEIITKDKTNGNFVIQMGIKSPFVFQIDESPNERTHNRLSSFESSNPQIYINAQESGSTLRFLIPVCIALNLDVLIDGKGTLVKRPLDDYISLFREKQILYQYEGALPIRLFGNQAHKLSGQLHVGTQLSSQFLSGLLFACPLLEQVCSIISDHKLKSEDYVQMSLHVLEQCGISFLRTHNTSFELKQGCNYLPKNVFVEGDYSCASFFIAAGILSEKVTICNLNPMSLQGDRKLLSLLEQAGARFEFVDDILEIYPSILKPMQIDAEDIIDSVPILCVLCASAIGKSKIAHVKRLRSKESDRINSSIEMILSLGGNARYDETADCIVIEGTGELKGGLVQTYSDHRIAMSASIAALICRNEVEIDNYKCVSKSYAQFFNDFKKLGGDYVF